MEPKSNKVDSRIDNAGSTPFHAEVKPKPRQRASQGARKSIARDPEALLFPSGDDATNASDSKGVESTFEEDEVRIPLSGDNSTNASDSITLNRWTIVFKKKQKRVLRCLVRARDLTVLVRSAIL